MPPRAVREKMLKARIPLKEIDLFFRRYAALKMKEQRAGAQTNDNNGGGSSTEDRCTTSDSVARGIKSYRRAYSSNVHPKAVAPFVHKDGEEKDDSFDETL